MLSNAKPSGWFKPEPETKLDSTPLGVIFTIAETLEGSMVTPILDAYRLPLLSKARPSRTFALDPTVAKVVPIPHELNFSIVLLLSFARYKLPPLNARPAGPDKPVLANTLPCPAELNTSMVLLVEFDK